MEFPFELNTLDEFPKLTCWCPDKLALATRADPTPLLDEHRLAPEIRANAKGVRAETVAGRIDRLPAKQVNHTTSHGTRER